MKYGNTALEVHKKAPNENKQGFEKLGGKNKKKTRTLEGVGSKPLKNCIFIVYITKQKSFLKK